MSLNGRSISQVGLKVIDDINIEANGDYQGYFRGKANDVLGELFEGEYHQIGKFIQGSPRIIIRQPEIEFLRGECLTAVMGIIGELHPQGLDTSCLRGNQLISNGVFSRDIDERTFHHALGLSNISYSKNTSSSSLRVRAEVRKGRRENKIFPFGKKGITRESALEQALSARDNMLAQQHERREKIASKSPNLKVARGLVEKGVLIEYEKGKFKVANLFVENTPYEGSSKMLRMRHRDIQGGNTSRSLDVHSFEDAFNSLTDLLCRLYQLNPEEVKEVKKYSRPLLYTQKTSRK